MTTCPKCKRQYDDQERSKACPHALLPVGKELDKALDAFVADKPKSIMRWTCLVCLWRLFQVAFVAAGLWSLYMLFCYTELACAMIGCSP